MYIWYIFILNYVYLCIYTYEADRQTNLLDFHVSTYDISLYMYMYIWYIFILNYIHIFMHIYIHTRDIHMITMYKYVHTSLYLIIYIYKYIYLYIYVYMKIIDGFHISISWLSYLYYAFGWSTFLCRIGHPRCNLF
jgi:hypothetical protein